ncbi:MAG: suppressor of fused domain protein [Clostridiales bacterium]|nr:suppressor of fused domain protein [Clostridiales bacterium]
MSSLLKKLKKLLVERWDFGKQKHPSQRAEQKTIIEHFETYFGKADSVLTDDKDGIDIYIVSPTIERPCYTLFTQGMSSRPMRVPPDMEGYEYAEIMLHLPFYWTLDRRPENYWPIEWLKKLARYPREHDTWLFYGRLIKGKEDGEAFAYNTELSCFTLGATRMLPSDTDRDAFSMLDVSSGKVVYFFTVLPLYIDEAAYRQEHSAEELFELFDNNNISDIIDIHRSRAVVLEEKTV